MTKIDKQRKYIQHFHGFRGNPSDIDQKIDYNRRVNTSA